MGIIKCQKCGSEISDKSTNCIICGYPVIESINTIKMAAVNPDAVKDNEVKSEPVKPVVPTSAPVEEKVLPDIKIAEPVRPTVNEPEKKKKGNDAAYIIVIVLLLLLLGGCAYLLYMEKTNNKDKCVPTELKCFSQTKNDMYTQIEIVTDSMNVRSASSADSELLGSVCRGSIFNVESIVTEEDEVWYQIKYDGTNKGFVLGSSPEKEYVVVYKPTATSSTSTTIFETTTILPTTITTVTTITTGTTNPATLPTVTTKSTTKSTSVTTKSTTVTTKSTTKSTTASTTKSTTKSTTTEPTTKADAFTYRIKFDGSTKFSTITVYKNGKVYSELDCSTSSKIKIPGESASITSARNYIFSAGSQHYEKLTQLGDLVLVDGYTGKTVTLKFDKVEF